MRVTTAFKRLLRLPGASVIDVSFTGEGVVVTVRLRRRRRVCSACGQTGRLEIHDRRSSAGGTWIWAPAAAGSSASCGCCAARTAACGWRPCRGRGRARTTRATSRTPWRGWPSRWRSRRSPGCSGSAGQPSGGSCSASSPTTSTRTASRAWSCIGVDEISYRRHHRYLTTVADHATGAIVWCAPGPQQRHPAGLLRPARRPQGLDPGGLDRHERRVPARHPRGDPGRPDLL